jgi:hypothetical protein
MRRIIFSLTILLSSDLFAQEGEETPAVKFTGYLEVYYLYDFGKPEDHTRPNFTFSYNRSNEINLNLGFVKANYASNRVRANLALMTGTYTNANMKNESGVLKNIFEANAGVKLSRDKEIWIDAGIFASHIGFESAIGKDSWNLTRSLLAENSPYYESGIKLSYTTSNEKWFLSGLILNGWQRIEMMDGNSLPSFGTQVTFKPSTKITLNSSSFIGTDSPDSARVMRYFHNFYGIFQLSERMSVTVGFDNGIEERKDGPGYNAWYSPIIMVRTKFNDKFSADLRYEYYDDRHNVIVKTDPIKPFTTQGISMNLDYTITSNALWRIELRHLASDENIFKINGKASATNTFVTTSLAVSF